MDNTLKVFYRCPDEHEAVKNQEINSNISTLQILKNYHVELNKTILKIIKVINLRSQIYIN